jgi:phosphoserine phosphatase RsbU/P
MGKKWGAWYFAIAYAGYVRSAIRVALQNSNEYSPKTILQHVNQSVYQDAKISEVFATLSILILDKKSKVVKYSGAGDLPIMFKDFQKNEVRVIKSDGMLLGFAADGFFEDSVIEMKENDFLVLMTDGIIESRNESGVPLGSDNLAKIINIMPQNNDPLDYIQTQFSTFTNNRYEDDISLITIRAKS